MNQIIIFNLDGTATAGFAPAWVDDVNPNPRVLKTQNVIDNFMEIHGVTRDQFAVASVPAAPNVGGPMVATIDLADPVEPVAHTIILDPSFDPQKQPTLLTKAQLLDLFTDTEQSAIHDILDAKPNTPQYKRIRNGWHRMMVDDFIDRSTQMFQDYVNFLESDGVIASGRADQIINA